MLFNDYFTEKLIENTYLYCYRRLNNSFDAQDLAQDILSEAVRGLQSGINIKNFNSWYWKLAHNRYCMFLSMKKYSAAYTDSIIEWIQDDNEPYYNLINQSEISELNYTVSKLSEIYREIIIMHYLKEMSVEEIALSLNIPEGTVKSRLYNARKDIKNIMETANFGKSTYAPASLDLWGAYHAPLYWDKINDLMTKQIFIACMKKPASIRQISDEIGVAPLYFEDKIRYLCENGFLKKENGGYLTDFCLIPSKAFEEFWAEAENIYGEISKKLNDFILSDMNKIKSLDFYGNHFDDSYLLWILYVYASEVFSNRCISYVNKKWEGKVKTDNGKDYRIAGKYTMPEERVDFKNLKSAGWSNLHSGFTTSGYKKVVYATLFDYLPFNNRNNIINASNIDLVMKIYDNPYISLTETQKESVSNLINLGYVQLKDNGLYLTFPVMNETVRDEIKKILSQNISLITEQYADKLEKMGEKHYRKHIRNDLVEEYVHWILYSVFSPVNRLFYYGLNESGSLKIPSDYSKSAAGICIYICN